MAAMRFIRPAAALLTFATACAIPAAGRRGEPPSRRRARPAAARQFAYLNPQVDSNQKAQIEASSRVFRDGVEIFTGTPQPMNTDVQTDMKKMVGGGALKLGGKMQPGDYVLQVVVTDKIAKATATQWSDFEVKDPGPAAH